jgi:hypothetical protein
VAAPVALEAPVLPEIHRHVVPVTSAGPFIIAAVLGTLASVTGLILVLRDRAALSRKRKENPLKIQLTTTKAGSNEERKTVNDIKTLVRNGMNAEAAGQLTHGMLCYLDAQKMARTPIEKHVTSAAIERVAEKMHQRKWGG